MTSDLKSRIESGDLHFLDGLVLLGTIASQRWFAGKSKDVLDARVLDAGVTPATRDPRDRDRRGALRTGDARPLSPAARLPSGGGGLENQRSPRRKAGSSRRDRRPGARAPDLRADADRHGAGHGRGDIVFRATGDLPPEIETARPMGAEQSNSSLVLDERYALKLYRRLAPGMNPELEVLRFLTERGFEHTAALEGEIAYEGRPLEATLAIVQESCRRRATAGSSARDARGRRAAGSRSTPAGSAR